MLIRDNLLYMLENSKTPWSVVVVSHLDKYYNRQYCVCVCLCVSEAKAQRVTDAVERQRDITDIGDRQVVIHKEYCFVQQGV